MDINSKITDMMAEIFMLRHDSITDGMTMDETDAWNSLTHMELVATLEDEFKIELSADEIVKMTSVAAVRETVRGKLA